MTKRTHSDTATRIHEEDIEHKVEKNSSKKYEGFFMSELKASSHNEKFIKNK